MRHLLLKNKEKKIEITGMSYSRGSRYLVVALVAATLITTASVSLTYSNAVRAAEDSLRLTALGIAVSLEATLSRMGEGAGALSLVISLQKADGRASHLSPCAQGMDGHSCTQMPILLIDACRTARLEKSLKKELSRPTRHSAPEKKSLFSIFLSI